MIQNSVPNTEFCMLGKKSFASVCGHPTTTNIGSTRVLFVATTIRVSEVHYLLSIYLVTKYSVHSQSLQCCFTLYVPTKIGINTSFVGQNACFSGFNLKWSCLFWDRIGVYEYRSTFLKSESTGDVHRMVLLFSVPPGTR